MTRRSPTSRVSAKSAAQCSASDVKWNLHQQRATCQPTQASSAWRTDRRPGTGAASAEARPPTRALIQTMIIERKTQSHGVNLTAVCVDVLKHQSKVLHDKTQPSDHASPGSRSMHTPSSTSLISTSLLLLASPLLSCGNRNIAAK